MIASNNNNNVLYSKGDHRTITTQICGIITNSTASQAIKYCTRPKPAFCLIVNKAQANIGQASLTGKQWQYILAPIESCDWLIGIVER